MNLQGNERHCTYEAPVPLLLSCTLMLLLATIVVGWCEWFMWLPGLGIPLCCDVTMSTASVMARWIILLELVACCCWWSLSCSLRRWQNQQEEIRPFGLKTFMTRDFMYWHAHDFPKKEIAEIRHSKNQCYCKIKKQNKTNQNIVQRFLLSCTINFSKIQLVVYNQCCVATTRLYVIAHQ